MRFRFNPFEWHHLYFGLMLLGLYFYVGTKWPNPDGWYALIALVGVLIITDDVWQHMKQATEPTYRSYLNRFFDKIWRFMFGDWWPFGDL